MACYTSVRNFGLEVLRVVRRETPELVGEGYTLGGMAESVGPVDALGDTGLAGDGEHGLGYGVFLIGGEDGFWLSRQCFPPKAQGGLIDGNAYGELGGSQPAHGFDCA